MEIKEFGWHDDKEVVFEWLITYWCNYQCPYCLTKEHKKYKLKTTEQYIEDAKKIREKLNKDTKYNCVIKGGEVCFLDLDKILSIFNGYKIRWELTTNFSNKVEYFLNLARKYDMIITTSYHGDQCNKDEFLDKIKKFAKYRRIAVTFVIGETTEKQYTEVINEINSWNNKNVRIKTLPMKIKDKGKITIDYSKKETFKILPDDDKSKKFYIYFNGKKTDIKTTLDFPKYFKNFDPYGYHCKYKYIFLYDGEQNKFFYHRCFDKNEGICQKHSCHFCGIKRIWK